MSSLATLKRALFRRRSRNLTKYCDLSRLGLEVGPSFQPIVPKSEGYQVEILDHLDADGLRAKYQNAAGIDVSRIEHVDHVWDGRTLPEVVGSSARFQWIIASHVAEHVPDFLGFLVDCSALLAPSGVLALALPDKRYTLDVLRPLSGLGTVIDAHLRKDSRPSPGVLAELHLRGRLRGSNLSWRPWNLRPLRPAWQEDEALSVFLKARTSLEYHDAHVWTFTPHSLATILDELKVLGLVDLDVVAIQPRWGLEFFIWLRKQ